MKKLQLITILILSSLIISCTKVKEVKSDDGRLIKRYEYKLDKNESIVLHGKYQSWYENGKIKEAGKYKNDQKNGLWQYFDNDGKIEREVEYLKGLRNGVTKDYYNTGTVKKTYNFVNDTTQGRYEYYHMNGKLCYEANLIKGKMDGMAIQYDSLGQKMLEENYDKEIKTGKWKMFENGKLVREFNYENGVPKELIGKWKDTNSRNTTYEFKTTGIMVLTSPMFQYQMFINEAMSEQEFKYDASIRLITVKFKNNKLYSNYAIINITENELTLEDDSRNKYELIKIQ